MGVRFRRSFKLFPGVKVNLGLRGVSTSFGVRGAHISVGRRGVYANVGVPGTGLSFSHRLDAPSARRGRAGQDIQPSTEPWPGDDTPVFAPSAVTPPVPGVHGAPVTGMREISSAGPYRLTSPSLRELRETLIAASQQMDEVAADLELATRHLNKLKAEYTRKTQSIFRIFHRGRIRRLENGIGRRAEDEVARLTNWQSATRIPIEFASGDSEQALWDKLTLAFDQLRRCEVIWDILRDQGVDKVRARSFANRAIDRKPVELTFASHRLIEFAGAALRLGNANGADIVLYPGIALVEGQGSIALIDLRDVAFNFAMASFVEEERVPPDAATAGATWLKVNKDGSPDRRFANNRQIPICQYGVMTMTTQTGLNEEYMFSNVAKLTEFAGAMGTYIKALSAG